MTQVTRMVLLEQLQVAAFLKGQQNTLIFPCKFSGDDGHKEPLIDYIETERGISGRFGDACYPILSVPPYQPGDVLLVPEPWLVQSGHRFECDAKILCGTANVQSQTLATLDFHGNRCAYDRFMEQYAGGQWHSPLSMPAEIIRLRLRVVSARVKRLQDVDAEEAIDAGTKVEMPGACRPPEYPEDYPSSFERWSERKKKDWFLARARATYMANLEWGRRILDKFKWTWDTKHARPRPIRRGGAIIGYESFPYAGSCEDGTHEGQPYRVRSNPYVWVIKLAPVKEEE